MTKKHAMQVAKHIKHFFPEIATKVYRANESRHGFHVQVEYGRKPEYITCCSVNDYKEAKITLDKELNQVAA